MKRLCTICARAGSKGIVNKNVRMLRGQPLIVHTVRQAVEAELFDHIAVSSDSEAILTLAAKSGAHQLVLRPAALAGDEAPKLPAIRHCAAAAERHTGFRFATVVDLDVTSPLRLPDDIRAAAQLLERADCANVITGTPSRRSPYFNMVERQPNGSVALVKPPSAPLARRQDTPETFDMNASVYVWKREALFGSDRLFGEGTRLYVMPAARSVDIDTEADLAYVEFLLDRRERGLDDGGV